MSLATQPHLAYRYLHRENAAILAPTHDLASKADGARFIARTVILEGAITIALVSIKLRYQQAEVLSDEFYCGVAKHPLSGRVNCLDDAATGMKGDDAVPHGIEYRLDQRATVAQGLLRCIFFGDIAEHQHGTDHPTIAVANRCATVGDSALATIAGNQYGVVGQAVYRAMRQGLFYRDSGRLTGFLVDDVKNLVHRPTAG